MLRLLVLVALALPGGFHARVTPIPSASQHWRSPTDYQHFSASGR